MSRYGRNPNRDNSSENNIPVGKLLIVCAVVMIGYVAIVMFTSDTEPVMCIEIMTLMLDDPEHSRLHNDYPELFLSLHEYIDENCQGVELPNRVSMGSGMEMP